MTAHQPAESAGTRVHRARLAPDTAFARVLGDAPDAVFVVVDETVTLANRAAERLLGLNRERVIGRPVADLLPGLGDGAGARLLELRRADGERVRVSVRKGRNPYGGNGETGSVLYLRDLGEGAHAERELERRNRELEHCVHTLSHDLRSPLVALLGFSRLLRQDYEARLDETGRHFLDRIEQAGRTMEDMIQDLLELSRIERGEAQRAPVDPRSVLLQLQAELKPRLDAAGVRLELPDSPPMVFCERTRLYQVFSNLIGNAIEHMGDCENPRVRVDVRDEGDRHCLCVRDFGRGVAPEDQERIFGVFESLPNARAKHRGSGIGLAIVRRIAEAHGGRAWVESQPGDGAYFHVTLPKE